MTAKVTANDCRTCGACCAGGYPTMGFADCTIDDVRRMSRRVRAQLISIRGRAVRDGDRGATLTDDQGRCTFLRGTVGRRASCRIYDTRPSICRAFRPGSRECLDARRESEVTL